MSLPRAKPDRCALRVSFELRRAVWSLADALMWWCDPEVCMSEGMRDELERQVGRLLEEAERPMRVEEMLPHFHPVMPSANDVAEVLHGMATEGRIERDGSFFRKSTPVPVEHLFRTTQRRDAAERVVEIIRELDKESGEGARWPTVMRRATAHGIPADIVLDVVAVLRNSGEAYSVGGDRLRLAKP